MFLFMYFWDPASARVGRAEAKIRTPRSLSDQLAAPASTVLPAG